MLTRRTDAVFQVPKQFYRLGTSTRGGILSGPALGLSRFRRGHDIIAGPEFGIPTSDNRKPDRASLIPSLL